MIIKKLKMLDNQTSNNINVDKLFSELNSSKSSFSSKKSLNKTVKSQMYIILFLCFLIIISSFTLLFQYHKLKHINFEQKQKIIELQKENEIILGINEALLYFVSHNKQNAQSSNLEQKTTKFQTSPWHVIDVNELEHFLAITKYTNQIE